MNYSKIDLSQYHPTVKTIVSNLEKNDYWYEIFEHNPVKTSEEAAKIRTGYSLEQGAKAIILKTVDTLSQTQFVQAVLPGDKKINSKLFSKLLEAKSIRFATTNEISTITNGIEIGGIPPFGNLFDLQVFLDKKVLNFDKIIFNAGDRKISIAMQTQDYLHLVKPVILSFSK